MRLIDPFMRKKEKLSLWARGIFLFTAFVFSIVWVTFLGKTTGEHRRLPQKYGMQSDLNRVGQGGFSLTPHIKSPALIPLISDMMVVGKNTRPDQAGLPQICLGLKGGSVRKKVALGQKLFVTRSENGYVFTDTQGDFQITPLTSKGQETTLQIIWNQGQEEVVVEESTLFSASIEDHDYYQVLKQSKIWGPDLFLQQWGGNDYRDLSRKFKIEVGKSVYFVSAGDLLWWDGVEWRDSDPSGYPPLAKVVVSTFQGAQLQVWDATGYCSKLIDIDLQRESGRSMKQEEIMSGVRSRAAAEVTCQLGKRRVTVKEGDWWVRNEGRWRPIKKADDLEAFLCHQMPGELFIFEKIESGKDRIVLKGQSFNRMRTESHPLALVFNTEKKHSLHPRKEESRAALFAKNKVAMSRVVHQQNKEGDDNP